MLYKRLLKIFVVCIIPVFILPFGCFWNTPEKVAERFVMSIQDLKWDAMVKIVDWDATSQFINNTAPEARKDIILSFASAFTRSDIKAMKEPEIRHKMLYMSFVSANTLEKSADQAKVKITCMLERSGDKNRNDVTLQLRKVNREWKVILTQDLLQRKN